MYLFKNPWNKQYYCLGAGSNNGSDLIRAIRLSRRPEHGVVRGCLPGLPEHPSDLRPLGAEPDAPAAAEDFNTVGRVISHEVEMFLGLKPVLNGWEF